MTSPPVRRSRQLQADYEAIRRASAEEARKRFQEAVKERMDYLKEAEETNPGRPLKIRSAPQNHKEAP
jgi:hypothetical protein